MLLLKAAGVASVDVKKLKDAGLCTVEAVAYSPRKELPVIKGNSDSKVDKIDHRSSDEAEASGLMGTKDVGDAETLAIMVHILSISKLYLFTSSKMKLFDIGTCDQGVSKTYSAKVRTPRTDEYVFPTSSSVHFLLTSRS
ncbi:hypothetical protein MKW98_010361 [Papaver atlanticum]|uniref:Uncharacterized protein n=1 Tax=Papaver atlanticum TaxID=357466 RepID=A0AAD4XGE3_9MAGN|nr:hypothetical protein MKW98_010361 [Papaver atlanticum]